MNHSSHPEKDQRSTRTTPAKSPVRSPFLACGANKIPYRRSPLVMGILNVTPDSFSDGGRYNTAERAVKHAKEMLDAGVDIIDVGGESTRPGSSGISAGEELDRVLPVIDALANPSFDPGGTGVPISIDTQKPEVADEALKHGCHLLNDIGAAAADPGMIEVLQSHGEGISVVIMHKLGDPKTMQESPGYEDVVSEVVQYLNERANALLHAGIGAERIVIDPGLGFGKRFRDNLELMNNLDSLRSLGYPVLVGASRKRFLGELLNADAGNRLPGSLAVAARCHQFGVEIVRVHDVNETVGLLKVLDAMEHPAGYEAGW